MFIKRPNIGGFDNTCGFSDADLDLVERIVGLGNPKKKITSKYKKVFQKKSGKKSFKLKMVK